MASAVGQVKSTFMRWKLLFYDSFNKTQNELDANLYGAIRASGLCNMMAPLISDDLR